MGKVYLNAVSAPIAEEHRHVAELAAVGDAQEATAGERWAFVVIVFESPG